MEQQEQLPPPELSTAVAVIFYGILLVIAWLLGSLWLGLDLLVWHDWWETPWWVDLGLGLGIGGLAVGASRVLERVAQWARSLTEEFRKILGDLTVSQVVIFALTSSVAEEIFFRGFLQQALSDRVFGNVWIGLVVTSVLFGLIHIGPDRKKFLPWTIMAVVMGFGFGLLYLYTGNILAPVLAHFTINFFNLLYIAGRDNLPSHRPELDS